MNIFEVNNIKDEFVDESSTMAKKYLDQLNELMEKIDSTKIKNIDLVCKHFFSGAAVYANGKICITLTPAGFAIKLPEKHRNKLLKNKDGKPLHYFPGSPIKKEYVVFSKNMKNNLRSLRYWIKISIDYVTDKL